MIPFLIYVFDANYCITEEDTISLLYYQVCSLSTIHSNCTVLSINYFFAVLNIHDSISFQSFASTSMLFCDCFTENTTLSPRMHINTRHDVQAMNENLHSRNDNNRFRKTCQTHQSSSWSTSVISMKKLRFWTQTLIQRSTNHALVRVLLTAVTGFVLILGAAFRFVLRVRIKGGGGVAGVHSQQ